MGTLFINIKIKYTTPERWQTVTNVFSPFAVVRRRSQWFAVVQLLLKSLKKPNL
jgi:hypothetical protein